MRAEVKKAKFSFEKKLAENIKKDSKLFFMVALCNRTDHYIFILFLLCFFFFFFLA